MAYPEYDGPDDRRSWLTVVRETAEDQYEDVWPSCLVEAGLAVATTILPGLLAYGLSKDAGVGVIVAIGFAAAALAMLAYRMTMVLALNKRLQVSATLRVADEVRRTARST